MMQNGSFAWTAIFWEIDTFVGPGRKIRSKLKGHFQFSTVS